MFTVTTDTEKNRLYITLAGHLEPDERQAAAKAFMAGIAELQAGFDIVNDISNLHPTDADGLKELARSQAGAKIKGVRTVIRIVRIPLSRLQLERLSHETGWEFETAASLEEANNRLDALTAATQVEA